MWASLRSDLKEFVTSVTEDTTNVLEVIDSKLIEEDTPSTDDDDDDNDDKEEESDAEKEERQGSAIIDEMGEVTYGGGYEETGIVSSPRDEVARLRGLEDTYLEPLLWPQGRDEELLKRRKVDNKMEGEDEEGENTEGKADAEENEEENQGENENEGENENALQTVESVEVEDAQTTPSTTEDSTQQQHEEDQDQQNYEDDEESSEVTSFLASFDVTTKTEEITTIISRHPNTVKRYFEQFVPTTISYELFWARYFYRCNEFRVEAQWTKQREETHRARQEALSKNIQNVKNLFGGAIKAVSHIVHDDDDDDEEDHALSSSSSASVYDTYRSDPTMQMPSAATTQNSNDGSKGIGASFFGIGGRPPFVMNTAVSDDDDNDDNEQTSEEEEEEEEEEELGWDDDDDDEDYETDDDDDDNNETDEDNEDEIVFGSPSVEMDETINILKRQLSQLETERDQLHQTVEMQSEEIQQLRTTTTPVAAASSTGDETVAEGTTNSAEKVEIERLKMLIFEKDSELAAVKASMNDTDGLNDTEDNDSDGEGTGDSNDKVKAAEAKVRKLTEILRIKDTQLEEKQKEVSTLASELSSAQKSLEDTKAKLAETLLELEESNQKYDSAQGQEEQGDAQSQIVSLSSELKTEKNKGKEAQTQIQSLESKLDKLREAMEQQSLNFAVTLEEEVSRVREEMQQRTVVDGTNENVHSPSAVACGEESESSASSSGVVKISKPSDVVVDDDDEDQGGEKVLPKISSSVDEDDDWGDW